MDSGKTKGMRLMREIGGYIEIDTYHLPMLHEDGIALNCGRNCLAYLFKSRGIRKIKLPFFICASIPGVCDREGIEKSFYHVGLDFKPAEGLSLEEDEWLYLVNYYGQLSNDEIESYVQRFGSVIVDQANDYFASPLPNVDTFYTCRKWFGVADGAFLYTDKPLSDEFPQDESFDRMEFLLGRYERTANEFYNGYNANNKYFIDQQIKKMSKLTANLLHGIDYEAVEARRRENFEFLQEQLRGLNQLRPRTASFMYPFMIEGGANIRKKLQAEKIYIPTLWPTVFELTDKTDLEYQMAKNILPLPIDQRYEIEDMKYMVHKLLQACQKNQVTIIEED